MCFFPFARGFWQVAQICSSSLESSGEDCTIVAPRNRGSIRKEEFARIEMLCCGSEEFWGGRTTEIEQDERFCKGGSELESLINNLSWIKNKYK